MFVFRFASKELIAALRTHIHATFKVVFVDLASFKSTKRHIYRDNFTVKSQNRREEDRELSLFTDLCGLP